VHRTHILREKPRDLVRPVGRSFGPSLVAFAVCCGMAIGCQALHEAGVPGILPVVNEDDRLEEQSYREKFLREKDPEALRWLLENRIHSGMTVGDVDQIIGENGEREYKDRWIKSDGEGNYRASDRVYRWGPDNLGRSIYLVFRDGQLVNFDPHAYADALMDEF